MIILEQLSREINATNGFILGIILNIEKNGRLRGSLAIVTKGLPQILGSKGLKKVKTKVCPIKNLIMAVLAWQF